MKTQVLACIVLAVIAGCGGGSQPGTVRTATRNPDVLTRTELLSSAQSSKDLFEAIRSLRPNFISPLSTRSQGAQSRALPKPVVYIDGALSGELEVLHSVMAVNVEEVRFKSPSEAAELAPNAPGGAIMVTLHKGP